MNPMVAASEDSYDLYNDVDDIDQNDTAEVTELLRRYVGDDSTEKKLHMGAELTFPILLPPWILQ
ncbi:hypothetical protein DSLASN_15230 [Desulfoluna limicola]|uniref:Uncharacterized protein n=1 Tax=Desulfoluna limicola TaxID=2810562 RepID=A0ABM7PF87_9BACT|nr:hypothetical protein [Desulfoluna limicola]BCS95891.1 hypothetical protein DSLASN_15230 [Desulfoluna limicola]